MEGFFLEFERGFGSGMAENPRVGCGPLKNMKNKILKWKKWPKICFAFFSKTERPRPPKVGMFQVLDDEKYDCWKYSGKLDNRFSGMGNLNM